MDHTIPKTKDVPSAQIILPQRQIGRKNGKKINKKIKKIKNFIKKN